MASRELSVQIKETGEEQWEETSIQESNKMEKQGKGMEREGGWEERQG